MKTPFEIFQMLKATRYCTRWMLTCRYQTRPLKTSSHGCVCNIHTPAGSSRLLVKSPRCVQTRLAHWQKEGPAVTPNSQTDASPLATTDHPFVVTVSLDAKTLQLREHGKDDSMRFNGTWLRHQCHCPKCRQASSGQWLYNPASLSPSFTIQSAKLQDETVVIEWTEEPGHCSVIPLVYLLSNDYSPKARQERHQTVTPTLAKGSLPTVHYDDIMRSGRGLLRWLEYLNEQGICLVTSVPTEKNEVMKVAERIAPVQRTLYGTVFDVESCPNPINVAYSDVALGLHTDLAYYESPPGLQFLHCLRFDSCVTGGESYLVDAWRVAEQMRHQHPREFAALARIPATFQKIHLQREWPVYMKYQRTHIVLGPEDQVISINWAPPFEGPLSVKEEDVEPYFEAYHLFATLLETSSDVELEKQLEEGEMLSFNNRRVLHARRQFDLNGGVRHLQGCYVHIDEFKSKMEVLSRTIGDARPAKRVFNNCFF